MNPKLTIYNKLSSLLINPKGVNERIPLHDDEVSLFVPLREIYPDLKINIKTLKNIFSRLSLTDTLFWASKINLRLGISSSEKPVEKQREWVARVFNKEEIKKINESCNKYGGISRVWVFFRGQMQELIRWAVLLSNDHENDGKTFNDPSYKKAFAQAALMCGEIWSNRVFGDRFNLDQGLDIGRKKGLGAILKSTEATAVAPKISTVIGRGWKLFNSYLPKNLSEFKNEFRKKTGLYIDEYFYCLSAIYTHFQKDNYDAVIFNSDVIGGDTKYKNQIQKFINITSQTATEIKDSMWGKDFKLKGDKALSRPFNPKSIIEKPIFKAEDGRAIILDPVSFSEKSSIGPLFYVLRGKDDSEYNNNVFSQFGVAFEDYTCDILRSMYPKRKGLIDILSERFKFKNALGQEFEIDALLNYATDLVLIEMKAVWLREDEILTDNHQNLLRLLKEQYGISIDEKGKESVKGLGQLSRIINEICLDSSTIRKDTFGLIKTIYPVLLVHDSKLSVSVCGAIFSEEFQNYLNPDKILDDGCFLKNGIKIAPPILMSINDLENLQHSINNFSMKDLLKDYTDTHPDRLKSLNRYIYDSKYREKIMINRDLVDVSMDVLKEAKDEIFKRER